MAAGSSLSRQDFAVSNLVPRLKSPWPVVVLWVVAVCLGQVAFSRYANTPARATAPVQEWPKSSTQPVQRGVTLVMAVHPQCPCTRASLSQLEQIMARSDGRMQARLLFMLPRGYQEGWAHSGTWNQAKAIPGVERILDREGQEARRFHLTTSGQTALFAADGTQIFSGGITVARGETGHNPAQDSIESYLQTGKTPLKRSPIFGCSLFSGSGQ